MKYKEITGDLFKVPNEYELVHCISADLEMLGGIVEGFNKRWDLKNLLLSSMGLSASFYKFNKFGGFDIERKVTGDDGVERVVHSLVTKRLVTDKPTYKNIFNALVMMKRTILNRTSQYYEVDVEHIKIAMPLIGCGIDGQEWEKVSLLVKRAFEDTPWEILVCKLR